MTRDRDVSLFVISVAARLSDLHPQTLRNYERAGLLTPDRTPGGNRMYSERDLDRLRRIVDLSQKGVNVVGTKLVLDLEDEVDRLRRENAALRESSG